MRLEDFYSLRDSNELPWPACVAMSFVEETGSTNDDLKKRIAQTHLHEPIGLTALIQTAGHGTRGRAWRSKAGGLYFSLALPLESVSVGATLIPLAVGEALAGALRSKGVNVFLKWPNDLWIRSGKAGGILCELLRDKGERRVLLIGVGINLRGEDCLTTNGWPICGVDEEGRFDTPELRTALLGKLVKGIFNSLLRDNESIIREWSSFDAFNNRKVAIECENERLIGRILGIDANGRLLLRTDGKTQAFSSGSISPYDDSLD